MVSLVSDTLRLFDISVSDSMFPLFREKSKKFAEQAAAIVCLRTLGLPEGRIGEENSGLVNKRKRDDNKCAALNDNESAARKRHISEVPPEEEEEMRCRTKVVNGDCGQTTS